MKVRIMILAGILLLAVATQGVSQQASANYIMVFDVLAQAGMPSSSAGYRLEDCLGQPSAIGSSSTSSYYLVAGYMAASVARVAAQPQHFTFKSNTGDSYSIVVTDATIAGAPLDIGDEIGVFTPAGLCVGASAWEGTKPLALVGWIDDSQTPEVDGYNPGEVMSFKIWDQSSSIEFLTATSYSVGNGNFGDGAYASVALAAAPPAAGVIIVKNTKDSGADSFRDAIAKANAHAGPDTIVFQIPATDSNYSKVSGVWTIRPTSALPVITDGGLLVDGASQVGFIGSDSNPDGPEIELDGTSVGNESGLRITAWGVGITGLVINRFGQAGISMVGVDGGRMSGCYIGTDAKGMTAAGNETGVWLWGGTRNVRIIPADTGVPSNLISGNKGAGVFISDSASHNVVRGNFVGLNRAGTVVIGNDLYGIAIQDKSDSNQVLDNRIGGNLHGVFVSGSDGNVITNNFIGTEETWQVDVGNQQHGVSLASGARGNLITENAIGNNGADGVNVAGQTTTGNRISRNWISKNSSSGINNVYGGNTELPPPTILSASATQITGTTGPGQTVEVFADQTNQGLVFLGSTSADPSGNFTLALSNPLPPLPYVTATATDVASNTSEFSSAFLVTGVADKAQRATPKDFALSQNYPNPFNPETVIAYDVPQKSHVVLRITGLLGQEVVTLVDKEQNPGYYSVTWDGRDSAGGHVASGIYLCHLRTAGFTALKKMVLIR